MTCSAASVHTYSSQTANGITVRHVCNEVKGSDGRVAVVRLRDTRVGEQVYCAEKEGKLTCPEIVLAVLYSRIPPGYR
jgi:hypothetical protein